MRLSLVSLVLVMSGCIPDYVGDASPAGGSAGEGGAGRGGTQGQGGKAGVAGKGGAAGKSGAAGKGGASGENAAGKSGAGESGEGGDGGTAGISGASGTSGGSAGQGGPSCGDGKREGDEACDGDDVAGATCESERGPGSSGDVTCKKDCTLNVSGCSAPPGCGDEHKGGKEDCDGTDLGGATCESVLKKPATGDLSCTTGCLLDTGACEFCGDGKKSSNEACDGDELGGATCVSVTGKADAKGSVTCTPQCTLEGSQCTSCGDGKKNGTEECDGPELGTATCTSVVGKPASGDLACTSACAINSDGCQFCGNGKKAGSEACDGSDFGGATCASVVGGAWTGALSCDASCTGVSTTSCKSPAQKPSCSTLASTCGSGDDEDCCVADAVPGGNFLMGRGTSGSDAYSAGPGYELPEHEVAVATFGLDRYETTVGRFRRFVAGYDAFRTTLKEGMGAHPLIAGSGWQSAWLGSLPPTASVLQSNLASSACEPGYQTWTASPAANENKPIDCVSWYEAFAFCVWDGGRLPTEAEWEYAAAGGIENRLYPWGPNAPTCQLANLAGCSGNVDAVGKHPTGKARWGQQDLAGNLWEWNLDWYGNSWYSDHAASLSCTNCADLQAGSERVLRGSDFSGPAEYLRATLRSTDPPSYRGVNVTLRCARN